MSKVYPNGYTSINEYRKNECITYIGKYNIKPLKWGVNPWLEHALTTCLASYNIALDKQMSGKKCFYKCEHSISP